MDKSWTYFLGRTAEGYAVYAELRAELVDEGRRITFTDHTETDEPIDRVSIVWVVADVKGSAQMYATNGGGDMGNSFFDRQTIGLGQVAADERVITDPAISPDAIAFIEQTWADHHLNTMHAACDHMRPGVDYEEPSPEDLPADRYGPQQALQGWRVSNVVCAAGTGYRYGHAWLARRVPADVWTRFLELAQGRDLPHHRED